jgi:hypothetical protein
MERLITILNYQPLGVTENVMDPFGIRIAHILLLMFMAWVLYKGRKESKNAKTG